MFSVTVLPVSNELAIGGSVLPDRFVSGSQAQPFSIVGDDFGSSVRLTRQVGEALIPATIILGCS